jgi:cobalamin synthase
MRAVFGLFMAFPIDHDPDDIGAGWLATGLVGLVLGIGWLVFHQTFMQLGGPFVAAGGVLLVHIALTGGRSLRGLAGVARAVTVPPDRSGRGGLPDVAGGPQAVVAVVLIIASGFLIRVDITPAVLVLVPLAGKAAQAVLLGSDDHAVGVQPPSPAQRIGIVVTSVLAMGVAPGMALLVRPVRPSLPVEGVGYVVLGAAALGAAVIAGLLARSWLRARFGEVDANSWHAIGAATEMTALATVALQVS